MPLKESLESGLDFVEFLGDRASTTSKTELRNIYNSEFRGREGIKDPSFSNVLYALVKFQKASARNGEIYINVKPQVRFAFCFPLLREQDCTQEGQTPLHNRWECSTHTVFSLSVPRLTVCKLCSLTTTLFPYRKKLTADKGGIEITSDPVASGGGKVQFTVGRLREPFLLRFHILNKGPDSVHFTSYTALHKIRCFTLEDERRVNRAAPLFLCPGESYEVVVCYRLNHYGYFPATMYFEFCPDGPASAPFCIVREMEAVAATPLAEELGPVAPYEPFQRVTYKPVNTVLVEGVPPQRSGAQPPKATVKSGDFRYPYYLKELAKQRMEDSEYLSPAARQKLASVKGLLDSPLQMKTYAQRLSLLLHLEEIQMEVDIRKYDLHDQTMIQDQSNKKLLALRVPGVAENRPSVLRGDCLRVSKSGDTVQPITVYAGYVHRVELDSVKLGFSKRLLQLCIGNMKFDVEFTLNRHSLRLQHRAAQLAVNHGLGEVLFPSGAAVAQRATPELRYGLENNPEQRAAVQRIVAGSSKPAPHLVFGPPGTGKTITMVEAMQQVLNPSARILACAPSNSACDLLCERLMVHTDASQIYRVYASSRDPRSIPTTLLTQAGFVFPEKEVLMTYRIIATTMVTAGRLVSGGIPVGHFTHVFLDEGGQAVEPECVIAIAGLLSTESGQLVLAGDPKQLGPILRSRFAQQYGLGLSLLERLMKQNTLYQKNAESGHFDTRFVSKLLRNYRSHASILKIPNELFYENELQVFADRGERETYCNWEHLPQKGFPLIFHGVMGKDEREANSPSFFNVCEIEVLVDYLTKLMETQGKDGLPKLSAKDIGIIAPYRKQVGLTAIQSCFLQLWMNSLNTTSVGSVEEFQGQERRIIMVSTVRSSVNYVKMDKDFSIGFLSNEKRFNVALTRARSLLIVVGNPVILNKDPTWEKFISYCVQENGYTGFHFDDAEGEDDIVSRLATLKINPVEESFLDQHWKNEH
uniref:RNA helicase n=1 Tax=Gasterosteus aculeatus aculeatus TaxID=481459 RepID=A0AAQ4QBB5_GASAC